MKKTILSIFTFLGLASTAQTLTYLNNAPAWGNIPFQTAQCDSTGVTPGSSGSGVTWNYTPTHLHSLKTYTTSNTLPNNPNYPSANVSVYSSLSDVAYHNTNTNIYNYYGGDLVINSYALNVKYANPATYAVYPMSLNTTTTSITSGTISLTLFGIPLTPTFNGTCNVIADATGTLTLPGRTFNDVIRLSTSQILSASGATVNLVNYDYYSPSASKAPIYSIQTSTINATAQPTSTQTITTVINNWNVVGVNETQKSDIELSVFPNPASTVINFSTSNFEANKIIAIDITGKIVATEVIEMGKAKINTSTLASGVYIYQVIDKNNQILTTGKFNVSK
jgi:hypothetical protein